LELPVKAELALFESVLERFRYFASKHEPENLLGKKEAVMRTNPALVIERKSTGRSNAMDMRMMFHFLIPSMENAEETDLGAETFGITGDFNQRFGTEPEEHVIDEFLVLQCERSQAAGQRKHNVSIGAGQDFGSTRLDPALSGIGLTLWAMPIAA
jgi:hypothetical protein